MADGAVAIEVVDLTGDDDVQTVGQPADAEPEVAFDQQDGKTPTVTWYVSSFKIIELERASITMTTR